MTLTKEEESESAQAFADTLLSCLINGATIAQAVRCAWAALTRNGKFIRLSDPGNRRLPRSEWAPLREWVLERDGHVCVYCGDKPEKLCADHVIPLSRGGSNDEDNLVSCCIPCNTSKSNRLPAEWRGRQ